MILILVLSSENVKISRAMDASQKTPPEARPERSQCNAMSGSTHLLNFLHALLHVVPEVFHELVDARTVFLQAPLGLTDSLRAHLTQLLRRALYLNEEAQSNRLHTRSCSHLGKCNMLSYHMLRCSNTKINGHYRSAIIRYVTACRTGQIITCFQYMHFSPPYEY